ncbi:MAG TPA: ribosome maturation factor RimM [Bacteroidales bacterium]|nr:ribosome maturation factor RimM [Bacteroidales bacterium]
MAGDPMARVNTILLGKIIKINGFEGAVTVRTERSFAGEIPRKGPVFLEIEGRPVPFFIEYSEQISENMFRFKFEGYNTAGRMSEFSGCNILAEASAGQESGYNDDDLSGFILESEDGKAIGRITGIIENPGQLLLSVSGKPGNDFLIPLHEDLIVNIDQARKKIVMIIPEGLIGLND